MKRSNRVRFRCRVKQFCAAMSVLLAVALFASSAAALMADELVTSEDAGAVSEGLWPAAPGTASDYYCVMDADSGAILAEKGMNVETPPASLTKIMTCLVALERGNLADEVTMTKTGVAYAVEDSSNLYTQVGEVFILEDMLYGMMLKSANDIATQIGEHVGGSLDAFLDMMNERAKELGCTGTNFANACGMPAEGHHSTAYDLCLISREALKNDMFREIVHTKIHTIPATNMNEERSFQNHHKFLVSEEYAYEGIIGGKTGYTALAGSCLATYVERNGRTVIVVALHCNGMSNCLEDTRELCDFGLEGFVNVEAPLPEAAAAEGEEASSDEESLQDAELMEGGILTIPAGASAKDCEVELSADAAADGTQTITCIYTLEGHEAGRSVYVKKDAGGVQELVGEAGAGTASGGEEILLLAEGGEETAEAEKEQSSGKNKKKKKKKDKAAGTNAESAATSSQEESGEQKASLADQGAENALVTYSTEAKVSGGGIQGVVDRGYAELPLVGRVGIVPLFGVTCFFLIVIIVLLILFNIHLSKARGRLKYRKKGDKDGDA